MREKVNLLEQFHWTVSVTLVGRKIYLLVGILFLPRVKAAIDLRWLMSHFQVWMFFSSSCWVNCMKLEIYIKRALANIQLLVKLNFHMAFLTGMFSLVKWKWCDIKEQLNYFPLVKHSETESGNFSFGEIVLMLLTMTIPVL